MTVDIETFKNNEKMSSVLQRKFAQLKHCDYDPFNTLERHLLFEYNYFLWWMAQIGICNGLHTFTEFLSMKKKRYDWYFSNEGIIEAISNNKFLKGLVLNFCSLSPPNWSIKPSENI